LRNCTKLRNSLLGNGELASLAYGSFKELLKFAELLLREEPRQGGLVARYRFVFGSSSALLARRYWSSVWVVVLRYIGRWFRGTLDPTFDLFVLGPTFNQKTCRATLVESQFLGSPSKSEGEEPDKRLVAVDFGPEEATLGEAES
jgi:hypothetical protein